jgi:hypothetical protein
MLKRQTLQHQIAIAGQVKNAITGRGISGAMVKIIDAPDEFINSVIFKTQLLGLPGSIMQWRSCNSDIHPHLPPAIQELREHLQNSQLNSADKLQLFQDILENNHLSGRDKFQGYQEIIDYFPYNPKNKQSQLGRTKTTFEGWFYFTNLPAGIYQLEAALLDAERRYTKSQISVEINPEKLKNVNINDEQNVNVFDTINTVELKLKPTTLFGKITNADDNEAIGMARVEIQGTREHTVSSTEIIKQSQGEWNYRLVAIEASNTPITVIVSAKGYTRQQKQIYLPTGEVKSLDFQLTVN